MAGFYNADELAADRLWEAAISLGRAIDLIDQMGRLDHAAIISNGDLADSIVIEGRDLAKAIRDFASRVDRSVSSRF